MLFLLVACASPPAPDSSVCAATPAVSWESWGHGFFLTWCSACHAATAPDRRAAPTAVTFDTWAEVQAQKDRIRARVLVDQDMPVGGGVPPEELQLLQALLSCSR